jgi:hypothetical protein
MTWDMGTPMLLLPMPWLPIRNNFPRSNEHELRDEVYSDDFPSLHAMPMTKLTWPDIFIDASQLDMQGLLANWPKTIFGRMRPLGCSAFGDLYFERENGQIERLDLFEGGIHLVAADMNDFDQKMNSQEWQEANLLTEGICLLKEKGIERGVNQFYGFTPHPALTGRINWASAVALDANVWHAICAQILDNNA